VVLGPSETGCQAASLVLLAHQSARQSCARSLAEKEKAARVLLPSAGGAAEMAATGSVQTARVTPSQAGLRLLSSQPVNLPCAGAGPITT